MRPKHTDVADRQTAVETLLFSGRSRAAQQKAGLQTSEDVGHRVLGVSWQDGAQVGDKLRRPKVHEQLPQTVAAEGGGQVTRMFIFRRFLNALWLKKKAF